MPDYDVIWNGRGATPQQALDAVYWERHCLTTHSRLLDFAHAPGSLLTQKDMANAKNVIPGGDHTRNYPLAGKPPGRPRGSKCSQVFRRHRKTKAPVTHCRQCGTALRAGLQRKGLARCRPCRREQPGHQRAKASATQ